jgi:hypothetical protein
MSSVFFLTNRLVKSVIGLAEFDHALSKIEKIKISLEQKRKMKSYMKDLSKTLMKYYTNIFNA